MPVVQVDYTIYSLQESKQERIWQNRKTTTRSSQNRAEVMSETAQGVQPAINLNALDFERIQYWTPSQVVFLAPAYYTAV